MRILVVVPAVEETFQVVVAAMMAAIFVRNNNNNDVATELSANKSAGRTSPWTQLPSTDQEPEDLQSRIQNSASSTTPHETPQLYMNFYMRQ